MAEPATGSTFDWQTEGDQAKFSGSVTYANA
jgi:hypothetical protein